MLCGLSADCKNLESSAETKDIWHEFTMKFGSAPFPSAFRVCLGSRYFQEIKGGNKMASALDRRLQRILLRRPNSEHLRHELAHLYLDTAWRILPYAISEQLVEIMMSDSVCGVMPVMANNSFDLKVKWKNRRNLVDCEAQQLLRNAIAAPPAKRDELPLY